MRVLVNGFVEYDADARHGGGNNMTGKPEDQLRGAIRLRQFSHRMEETCAGWHRDFVRWHKSHQPWEMGAGDIPTHLTHLA